MTKYLLLILIYLSTSATAQINFKRQKHYGRISMTINDFKKLIKTVQYYHSEQLNDTPKYVISKNYNGSPEQKKAILDYVNSPKYSISMEINDGNQTQELSSFEDIDKLDLDGKTYDRLSFTYLNLNQPISEIRLVFSSGYRTLSIGGNEKRKVDGAYRELDEQLSQKVTAFSFIRWDMIFSILLSLSFIFVMLVITAAKTNESAEAKKRYLNIKIICGIYAILCIVYFFSNFNLEKVFPQFQLKPDDIAWWDRYGNLIGVIGFFGTVYFGVVKIVRQLFAPLASINSKTINYNNSNPIEQNPK